MDLGDPFRQVWKRRVVTKDKLLKSNRGREKLRKQVSQEVVTSALFVPSSEGGTLTNMLSEEEKKLGSQLGWNTKIVEKSGIPLSQLFKPKFEILAECTLGQSCPICDNTGLGCNLKNVIYSMQCLDCTNDCGDDHKPVDTTLGTEVINNLKPGHAVNLLCAGEVVNISDELKHEEERKKSASASHLGTDVIKTLELRREEYPSITGEMVNISDEVKADIRNFTYVGKTS